MKCTVTVNSRVLFIAAELTHTRFLRDNIYVNIPSTWRRVVHEDVPSNFIITLLNNKISLTFESKLCARYYYFVSWVYNRVVKRDTRWNSF
jgi:hypothetical protein